MSSKPRPRLSYANVMATIAVALALVAGGGQAIGATVHAAKSLASRVSNALKTSHSANKRSKRVQKKANQALTRANDTYTRGQSDVRFLGIGAKAHDSDLFDGLDSPRFLRYGATVPPGQTLRGIYGAGAPDADANLSTIADVSFPVPFAADLTAVYVNLGDTPPANCPGTVDQPAAKPGFLCLFEGHADHADVRDVNDAVTTAQNDNKANRFGFQVAISRTGGGPGYAEVDGTWAATAPAP